MINSVEILAPAGAREQLEAAVHSGADAVYLGYGSFNARRKAKNFTFEELCDAVRYCHIRGVKVHVTLNTLLCENELQSAYEDAVSVARAGADAVIVQDLGLARIIRRCIPGLEMHASTQMTVHNVHGVKMLERLGFSRVVLSRELSLDEIREICASTSLEVEVFIHGALCMCMSGACYLSSLLGQRSGNRGLCAQPCRLDFRVRDRDYALSLKDMSHIDYILKLREAGVKSFKIEGRMKRPEYVACAVSACRRALNGESYDKDTLRSVFSRSGFTDGYITGKRTLDMFGHRGKDDVEASSSVLKSIEASYRNELQSVPLNGKFTMHENKPCELFLSDGTNGVTAYGADAQKAISHPLEKDELLKQLKKTGGTPYFIEQLALDTESGLNIPASALNALRRDAVEKLTEKRAQKSEYEIKTYDFNICTYEHNTENNWIRLTKRVQASELDGKYGIILPPEEINTEIMQKFKLVAAEIPSLLFTSDEGAFIKRLTEVKEKFDLKYALCENIGAIGVALDTGLDPIAGYGMNILNSEALETVKAFGADKALISFESSVKNYRDLQKPVPCGLIGYGYLPLMRMRACPAQGKRGCADCNGKTKMRDRLNTEFTLMCNGKKFTTLLNSVPLYIGDKNVHADFFMLYFNLETPHEVLETVKMFERGDTPAFERTNGLYFKSLR